MPISQNRRSARALAAFLGVALMLGFGYQAPVSVVTSSEAAPKSKPSRNNSSTKSTARSGKRTPPEVKAGNTVTAMMLPLAKPEAAAPLAAALPQTFEPDSAERLFGLDPAPGLKEALDAISENKYLEAAILAEKVDSIFDRRLIAWLIARAPNSGLTPDQILAIRDSLGDWPEPDQLELRAEQALLKTLPTTDIVLRHFKARPPITQAGRIALASAYFSAGDTEAGRAIIRKLWREETLSDSMVTRVLAEFGSSITQADHKARLYKLIYQGRSGAAGSQAKRLGADYEKMTKAVLTALGKGRPPAGLLVDVAPALQSEPPFQLAQVKLLRQAGKPMEAARILAQVTRDPEMLVDPDVWWKERKSLSRALLDAGQPGAAYEVVAGHSARSPEAQADAEFHAGWYALRFLNKPQQALPHFERLVDVAGKSRTIARAHYWLGRAHEAMGNELSAQLSYKVAARHGATFYGQLAREKAGLVTTGLEDRSEPTAGDRLIFAERDTVRAIRRLVAAGHAERTLGFFDHLAHTLESPGELTLTANLAHRIGKPRTAMVIGSIAEGRGMLVGALRAPLIGIPRTVPTPEPVDRALVYAISRQESAFNPEAVSHVGARGLMQLMPATAKATARSVGLPYAPARLTGDPTYNATLGAAHLAELMGSLKGSYILTFVGYNAGPGRARTWVSAYGDPRGAQTDPVDWIERIPFDETRDYVQKVMENLQAYRSRLGYPLSISRDLARGAPRT